MKRYNEREIINLIPTNWLDPLLTGDKKVIGQSPFQTTDIERLLFAIQDRIRKYFLKREKKKGKK